jgi:hypothetical protein
MLLMPATMMLKRDGALLSRLGRYLLSISKLMLRTTRVPLPGQARSLTQAPPVF